MILLVLLLLGTISYTLGQQPEKATILTASQVKKILTDSLKHKFNLTYPIFRIYHYADPSGQYYCLLTQSMDSIGEKEDTIHYHIRAVNLQSKNGPYTKPWELNDHIRSISYESSIGFWTRYTINIHHQRIRPDLRQKVSRKAVPCQHLGRSKGNSVQGILGRIRYILINIAPTWIAAGPLIWKLRTIAPLSDSPRKERILRLPEPPMATIGLPSPAFSSMRLPRPQPFLQKNKMYDNQLLKERSWPIPSADLTAVPPFWLPIKSHPRPKYAKRHQFWTPILIYPHPNSPQNPNFGWKYK